MMMMGLELLDEVPFREVFMHGLVRDEHGEKMSKVKGNVLDPLDVIETAGADALRFTLAIMAVPARDIPWNPRRMEGYRTFANKLWQAARFVQMNLGGETSREVHRHGAGGLDVADRWILSRLEQTVAQVDSAFAEYRFHEAADALYHFAWDEYCAWFIEMAKPALGEGADPVAAATKRRVLLRVLDDCLRLLHPFMPFLTEEIWQHFPHEGETIQRASWPRSGAFPVDEAALEAVGRLQEVVTALRNLRAETGLDPKQRLPVRFATADGATRALLAEQSAVLQAVARTQPPELLDHAPVAADRQGCAVAEAAGVSVLVPLSGLLDVEAETRRLTQQAAKAEQEARSLAGRLANAAFTGKAPAEVVAETRARHLELVARVERLQRTLAALRG
jgi:valyl-tRNA synthetase